MDSLQTRLEDSLKLAENYARDKKDTKMYASLIEAKEYASQLGINIEERVQKIIEGRSSSDVR